MHDSLCQYPFKFLCLNPEKKFDSCLIPLIFLFKFSLWRSSFSWKPRNMEYFCWCAPVIADSLYHLSHASLLPDSCASTWVAWLICVERMFLWLIAALVHIFDLCVYLAICFLYMLTMNFLQKTYTLNFVRQQQFLLKSYTHSKYIFIFLNFCFRLNHQNDTEEKEQEVRLLLQIYFRPRSCITIEGGELGKSQKLVRDHV